MIEASALVIPAFIAGLITFLAPCTLPLVPAYLAFISGVSPEDLNDPKKYAKARVKIFINGLFFVIGVSTIFVLLGVLIGSIGGTLGVYRIWLERLGGLFIMVFGLYMLRFIKIPFFLKGRMPTKVPFKPGNPAGSFILGLSFGTGWTPCIGPIVSSILLLAASSATAVQGGLLLLVFSAGLSIPFLIIAVVYGWATKYMSGITKYLRWVEIAGGLILIVLGAFIFSGKFVLIISYAFEIFGFLEYNKILNYL